MATKDKTIALFVVLFIGLIVAIAFTVEISNSIKEQTGALTQTDEAKDISGARVADGDINESFVFAISQVPGVNTANNTLISDFSMTNLTGDLLTNATDYAMNLTSGTYTLVNTTAWVNQSNVTAITYSYNSVNFVADSNSRSVISLILIIAALAIVMFAIVMLFMSDTFKNITQKRRFS